MKPYSYFLLPLILLTSNVSGRAQRADVSWQGEHSLSVSLPLRALHVGARGDYAECVTPALVSASGDTLRLTPVIFRGRRNARYVERGRLYGTERGARCLEPSASDTLRYSEQVATAGRDWLLDDTVRVITLREREGCCDIVPLPETDEGLFAYDPPFRPVVPAVPDNTGRAGALEVDNPVLLHISKYRPYDDTRILRKERGALYVHFPLDRYELLHDFRDNGPILDRIVDVTRQIMADTTSSVCLIQIIGLASPEGPVRRNLVLGRERALALKEYIRRHVSAPDSLFECINGGEAWTELRDQIAESEVPGRDDLLHIIDTERDADRRERRMKQLDGGRPYAYLKQNVLADQRNSGYLRIYYDYVPDHAAATINRAVELLHSERWSEALDLLRTVADDPRADNAMGVALYMTGRREEGIAAMRRAAAAGHSGARENLKQLRADK